MPSSFNSRGTGVLLRRVSHKYVPPCAELLFYQDNTRKIGDVVWCGIKWSSLSTIPVSRLRQDGATSSCSNSSARGFERSSASLGSRQTLAFTGFLCPGPAAKSNIRASLGWWRPSVSTGQTEQNKAKSPNPHSSFFSVATKKGSLHVDIGFQGCLRPSSSPTEGRNRPSALGELEQSLRSEEVLLSTPSTIVFNRETIREGEGNIQLKRDGIFSVSGLFPAEAEDSAAMVFRGVDPEATGAIALLRVPRTGSAAWPDSGGPQCVPVYLAVLRGHMPTDVVHCRSSVCSPSPGSVEWRLAGERTEGKAAYSILQPIVQATFEALPVTLVEIRLVQGPASVPRLHAASLGHPVVGDTKYGTDRYSRRHSPCQSRLMLHSWILKIGPPYVQQEVQVEAPDNLSCELGLKRRGASDSFLVDDSVVKPMFGFFENPRATTIEPSAFGVRETSRQAGSPKGRRPPSGGGEGVGISLKGTLPAACEMEFHGIRSKYSDNNTYWDKLGGSH